MEKIFNNRESNSDDFIYGDAVLKRRKTILGGSRTYSQLIGKNICQQAILYRKNIFDKIGQFNLKYKILSDYEFNLRIFRDQSISKKYIATVVTLYNDNGLSKQIIDSNFYKDQLNYFLNTEKLSARDYRLQTYFFFYAFALLLNNKTFKGIQILLYSLSFGKRKFYYFLVSIKYFLTLLGFWKKIKASSIFEEEPALKS